MIFTPANDFQTTDPQNGAVAGNAKYTVWARTGRNPPNINVAAVYDEAGKAIPPLTPGLYEFGGDGYYLEVL
jgi:hypothetical protein